MWQSCSAASSLRRPSTTWQTMLEAAFGIHGVSGGGGVRKEINIIMSFRVPGLVCLRSSEGVDTGTIQGL